MWYFGPWSLSTSVQEEWPLWGICQRREGRLDTLWIIKLIRVSLWIFMLPSCEQGSTFLELFIADSTAFQARMSTCLGLDDETPHISPLDHWDMVLSFIDSNPKEFDILLLDKKLVWYCTLLYQRWLVVWACWCVHFWAVAIANPPKNRRFDLLRGCRDTGQYLRRLWGDVAWLEHAGAKVGCDMGLPSCSKLAVYPCWLMNYSGLYFPKKRGLS